MQTPQYLITLNNGTEIETYKNIGGNKVATVLKNIIVEHSDVTYRYAVIDIFDSEYDRHLLSVVFGHLSAIYQRDENGGIKGIRMFLENKLQDSNEFASCKWVSAWKI